SWLTLLIAGLVTVWAARLTSHIARRNSQRPEDPRYVAISEKWQGNLWLRAFFSIYLLQGGLIWAIGLPISLAGQSLSENASLYIVAGLIVWIVGFTFESIGDRQLKNYLASKPTKNQVLDTGLWRYSRHPNYFGEIFLWYGIGIMACSTGNLLSLIGPTILYITIRYFSGVPPIENKRCNNTAYQAYKARTSVLIPLPPRAARLG
ncbi:MAG: DUF1295 domain-containing protein, partial [Candidatus Saccharimonadales bacterium]